jgi:hypothetical protein
MVVLPLVTDTVSSATEHANRRSDVDV